MASSLSGDEGADAAFRKSAEAQRDANLIAYLRQRWQQGQFSLPLVTQKIFMQVPVAFIDAHRRKGRMQAIDKIQSILKNAEGRVQKAALPAPDIPDIGVDRAEHLGPLFVVTTKKGLRQRKKADGGTRAHRIDPIVRRIKPTP